MCVILSTIYAYAEDQCGRDVHGCLVVSRSSDVVAGLAVLTEPCRDAAHSLGRPVAVGRGGVIVLSTVLLRIYYC